MARLIKLEEVLDAVYQYGSLSTTKDIERPMTYNDFKRIMVGTELMVTDRTIRAKYDQIVFAGFGRESVKNRNIIILYVQSIREELIKCERIINLQENEGAYTHTHIEQVYKLTLPSVQK